MTRRIRTDPDRARRRAERRERLLDAAAAVIRRDGPHASMDDLAREAGVTKPILYRHFGDRAGLVAALADRFGGELVAVLSASVTADGSPRRVLADTIDAYVGFVETHPQVYRFLTVQALPERPAETVGIIRRVAREVAVVLGERLRAAGADSGAAEPWAHGIVGMVHMAGDWWVGTKSMPRERLVEYLTALLWSGMSQAGLADADAAAAPLSMQRVSAWRTRP